MLDKIFDVLCTGKEATVAVLELRRRSSAYMAALEPYDRFILRVPQHLLSEDDVLRQHDLCRDVLVEFEPYYTQTFRSVTYFADALAMLVTALGGSEATLLALRSVIYGAEQGAARHFRVTRQVFTQ